MNNKNSRIKEFIYKHVFEHPSDIALLVSNEFGFSRQNALRYISREVRDGKIIKVGRTNSTRYFEVGGKKIEFNCEINKNLAEDQVWSKYIKPMTSGFNDNIKRIIAYGFTEIYNNAIDHSGGTIINTNVEIKNNNIEISIIDNGIGIFKKIHQALKLDSVREAILHLSKGKFTTDPSRHSGEGIFFTSRIFTKFSILSGDLFYSFENQEWLLSHEKEERFGDGTLIKMVLNLDATHTSKDIMDKYADVDFDIGFWKTIVAVSLSSSPDDPHVSRSQAKRLMMGLDKFKTVVLDFKNVSSVGQAFVDEIFRVFRNNFPEISIEYINANQEVDEMIKRGLTQNKLSGNFGT
jgi:anti-sigma regulatory factor (Ser/Thr protein kinase)